MKEHQLLEFVKHWHGDQVRKYTGEPYWHHLVNVAEMASIEPLGYEIGLCHDLLEDTKCSYEILYSEMKNLGYSLTDRLNICNAVIELTDVYTKESCELNRAERKRKESDRLGTISKLAQSVKYADLIDNTKSIAKHDPKFAKVYLAEKRAILDNMRNGNIDLLIKCCWTLEEQGL